LEFFLCYTLEEMTGVGKSEVSPVSPPVFGRDSAKDFKPKPPEHERWITIGQDTWMYDSPIWDPTRIRLGRARSSTRVKILQEVKNPTGKGMDALEVLHPWKDKEGEDQTSKFWVYPRKGGFYGMSPKARAKPNPTLGLDKL